MNRPYVRIVVLTVLLIAAWVLWSGYFKPLLLGLGALSCLLTVWLVHRMGHFDDDEFAFHYDWRLLGFWGWLAREVVLSSIEVARVVLRRRMELDPKVVTVDGRGLQTVDLALLGNSITLTPGTLTLDVHDGRLLVHALTSDGADALKRGEMQRRVGALRKR
jgi:multicomponent Na+:H+ antiporter subunit E